MNIKTKNIVYDNFIRYNEINKHETKTNTNN